MNKKKEIIFITGSAGFVGFHLSQKLLNIGFRVVGLDAFTDYYDVSLKRKRNELLCGYGNFTSVEGRLEDYNLLKKIFDDFKPEIVIHLAAQAGVRYSRENPRSYLETNLVGSFNILDLVKNYEVKHLLIASSSSVYGANKVLPFKENDKCDFQLSFYASTKKAIESMSHAYSHNYSIPITLFRFFTVYGPWGRPDMALFKFTNAIISNKKIDVFNRGNMERDFTYIDDLVEAIYLLIKKPPLNEKRSNRKYNNDSLSDYAPWRVLNIGNTKPIKLMKYIKLIETALGKKAKINFLPMQIGDMKLTWSDNNLLKEITGFEPKTSLELGIKKFVAWYKSYYS